MNSRRIFLTGLFLLGALVVGTAVFLSPSAQAAPTASITVNTTSDVLANDGECSLREAIIAANTNTASGILLGECSAGSDTETDIITLANGDTYTLSIAGINEDDAQTGDLDILDNSAALDVQIVVANDGSATIDADTIDRVLETIQSTVEIAGVGLSNGSILNDNGGLLFNNNGVVTIDDATLINGRALTGGAIANFSSTQAGGKITLNNVTVTLNQANDGGGIIQFGNNNPTMTLTDTLVRANTVTGNGGGINSLAGTVTLNGGGVTLNNAVAGAGIYAVGNGAVLTINNTAVEANTASGDGGGIYADDGMITLNSGDVSSNEAASGGGIFVNVDTAVAINGGSVRLNEASVDGAGIYLNDVVSVNAFTITNAEVDGNIAIGNGGGIYGKIDPTAIVKTQNSNFSSNQATDGGAIFAANAKINGGTFDGNIVSSDGGAVMVVSADITNAEFSNNNADIGGALHVQVLSAANIDVNNNKATQTGGGAYILIYASEISGSNFSNNTAGTNGGGLYLDGNGAVSATMISRTAVVQNLAANDGAGIWAEDNAVYITNSTISSNNATGNGDGLFIEATAAITATNATIAFNTPGEDIYKVGEMTVQNSIIFSPGGNNCSLIATPLISLGNNLAGDGISCAGLTELTDEINPNVSLGLLQDNGGNTLTHDLLPGSPAIDTGSLAACTGSLVNSVDQRGIPRPIAAACDKGAVERGSAIYLPIILK